MEKLLVLDYDLIQRLPLPLAQLYRRAHNAKTPLDRHLAAFYLWEAALKLLGSAAIGAYAEQPSRDPTFAESLQRLARPALGHWWDFARRLVPALADGGDPGYQRLNDTLLRKTRDDCPRAAGLDAWLLEALDGKAGARSTVRFRELFEHLLRFRNSDVGHGAAGQRPTSFYERSGPALLAGLAEALRQLDVLAGRRLVYVDDLRRLHSDSWLIEWYELHGEAARRLESIALPQADVSTLPHPGRLYLVEASPCQRLWRTLHPLILYDADACQMLFLNARRGPLRAEYLCYTSGELVRREELIGEHPRPVGTPLEASVDEATLEASRRPHPADEPSVAPDVAPSARAIGEFRLLSRLGQGGMGVVYRAWQPSLGRQVALKCMLRTGDPKAEARFAREIRALGRVEHPHVVKVFTSGADGEQWFYAMELVEGADLARVCTHLTDSAATTITDKDWTDAVSTACSQQRHQEVPISTEEERPVPAAPPNEAIPSVPPRGRSSHVARVVELVRQAAEAAQALHEAGVVHRDIKPGNIMITPDGQHAVLMDLGLAQLIDETEGRLTRTRQFVGTLRYASPEQVLAARRVDQRTDVYSLGATLWELVALRSLYGATDETPTPELMERIQSTEPEKVTRYNASVPGDLQAIITRCLEKDRTRRYSTALQLAEDLARWQRGEVVLAQPPSLSYILRKQLHRYRVPLAVTAGVVLLVVAISIGSFVRISLALDAKTQALDEKNDALQLAQRRGRQAREALDAMTSEVIDDLLAKQRKLTEPQKKILFNALASYEEFARDSGQDPDVRAASAEAYFRVGNIQKRLGEMALAEKAFRASIERFTSLAEEFPQVADYRYGLAKTYKNLGLLLYHGSRSAEATAAFQQAVELGQALVRQQPDVPAYCLTLASTHNNFGMLLDEPGKRDKAEQEYRSAVLLFGGLADRHPERTLVRQQLAAANDNLAIVLGSTGRGGEAESQFRRALAIREGLVKSDPREPSYRMDLAVTHNNLGVLLATEGRLPAAEKEYRQSLEGYRALAADYPAIPDYPQSVAEGCRNLALLLQDLHRRPAAEDELRQAIGVLQRLVADFPRTPSFTRDLAAAHRSLGKLLREDKAFAEAEKEQRMAMALSEELAREHPHEAEYRRDIAYSYHNLAALWMAMGRRLEAERDFGQALKLYQQLSADYQPAPEERNDVADILVRLGQLLDWRGDYRGARERLEQALPHHRAALKAFPGNSLYQRTWRDNMLVMGDALIHVSDHAAAAAMAERVAQCGAEPADDRYNAACFLARCVPLAERDAKLSKTRAQELVRTYGERAVKLLHDSVAAGYRDVANATTDTDLNPLRGRPDFKKWLADLQTAKDHRVSGK